MGGSLLALAALRLPGLLWGVALFDLLLLAAVLTDAWRATEPGLLRGERRLREPLSGFAHNGVELRIHNPTHRTLRLELADAPPVAFDARGHRGMLRLPRRSTATWRYGVVPRERGRHRFGDLAIRVRGPWGLGARQAALPLTRDVRVFPDLRGLAAAGAEGPLDPGRNPGRGPLDGREFADLRAYAPGDDVRAIDWKATAKRNQPIVREFEPERNQILWILLDCGRHLAGRLYDGRTKLDHAVDASLSLARAAVRRGDQVGILLFGAEVERVVPPGRGSAQLGPIAEALFMARARVEEPDYDAAFDALLLRQRRRALVVLMTDIADPDTSRVVLARASQLRSRHLVLVAAVSDSAVADTAAIHPENLREAYLRIAAERILEEREAATRRLQATGVRVANVSARELSGALVASYLAIKRRGTL
jgi:uncharacterized protein (DUF58 family)